MSSDRRSHRTAPAATPSAGLLALVLGLGLSLAACQPAPSAPGEPTVGQKTDAAVATAQSRAAEATASAKEATAEIRAETSQAVANASNAMKDAAITTAVTAKLAADPDLKALRINVDTTGGRVALSGDAPDKAARDRATSLARSVDGVSAVNNQLTIKSKV